MNREYECYRLIPSRTKRELNDWFDNCMKDGRTKESLIFELCQEYDLYFDYNLANNSNNLDWYIKNISMFSPYKGKKFKDSIINIENQGTYELPEHYHNFVINEGLNICGCELNKKNLNSTAELKLDLLCVLQKDQQLLLEKMGKAIEEDNMGTYRNLLQALERVTYLIQKEEWRQQWSKYSCDGKEYVAVWEQRGSDIRNHRQFEINN